MGGFQPLSGGSIQYLEFPEQWPSLSDSVPLVQPDDRVQEPDDDKEDREDETGDGEDDEEGLDHPGEVEDQEDLVLMRMCSGGIPLSHVVIKVRMILKNVHFPLITSQGLHKTEFLIEGIKVKLGLNCRVSSTLV